MSDDAYSLLEKWRTANESRYYVQELRFMATVKAKSNTVTTAIFILRLLAICSLASQY